MALDNYLKLLTPKSRVIVALLSHSDLTFEKVRSMTIAQARNLIACKTAKLDGATKADLLLLIDGKQDDEKAFSQPSGRAYSINDLDKILRKAHERAGVKYVGREVFVKNISKNKTKT